MNGAVAKAHFAAKKRQDGRRWFKVAWRTRNLRDVVAQSLSKAIHHRRHQKVPEDTIHAGTKPDECAWLGWREANGTWVLYSMRGDPTASTGNEDVPFGVDTVKHPCRDWACPPNNPNLGSGGTPKCSRMQYCWKATAYQATRSQGLAGHPQNSHGMVAAPPSPAPHVPDWS